MTAEASGPWPIALRRNSVRLLILVGLRAAVGMFALLTASATFGTVATVLNVVGALCLTYSVALLAYLFSLRLETAPGELRIRSLLGTRRYALAKGEVTRLWVQFSRRTPLEARVAGLGVRVGEGQLGRKMLVDVISLEDSQTLMLVPVRGGRVAVAASSEPELLDALERATRSAPASFLR
jgi:hypothetical protein